MKIFKITRTFSNYANLKNSDKRKDIVRYGIKGIIFSLLTVGVVTLFSLGINMMSNSNFIIGLILLLIGASLGLGFLFYAVLYNVFQLTLNRKIIGFVSLIILIGSIIGSVLILNAIVM